MPRKVSEEDNPPPGHVLSGHLPLRAFAPPPDVRPSSNFGISLLSFHLPSNSHGSFSVYECTINEKAKFYNIRPVPKTVFYSQNGHES